MFVTFDNSFKTKLSLTQKIHARDNNVHKQNNKLLYYSADIGYIYDIGGGVHHITIALESLVIQEKISRCTDG